MFARPRKAFSYVRLSTDLQLRGSGLQRQLEASKAYADANGLVLQEDDQLRDIGISAYKGANIAEGSALGQFLAAMRDGRIEPGSVLIIESLDRLSRQAVLKSLGILIDLINSGITVVTLVDGKRYTAETGFEDLIFSIVALGRAHDESRTKSIRISAAWKNKRNNASTRPMTAMAPQWLRLTRDRKGFEVIPERASVIRNIFADCASGMGIYVITQRLNRAGVKPFGKSRGWHSSYVARILSNRAVLGEMQPCRYDGNKRVPDGEVVKDYYPRLIDDDAFYRARNALGSRRNNGAGRKGEGLTNLFSGLAACAYCRNRIGVVNKGSGPKGGRYLVCDASRRGLGCESTGWRLEHFEASFLSFVREIDIESLVRDDESKTRALDDEIAALRGRLASVREQMEKSYQLLSAGAATDFVAGKLRGLEAQRVELETTIDEREKARAELDSNRASFQDIKPLLELVQSGGGDEVYKLRSLIAARLRSIVETILVAPRGGAPMMRRAIELLRAQQVSDPAVIDHLERTIDEKRYFNVAFVDGSTRAVFPDADDPLKFKVQLTSSTDDGLVRRYPDHDVQVFPPRLTEIERGHRAAALGLNVDEASDGEVP